MRLGPGLLYEGRTLQGARPKLADFCSATMAEFYSAVDTPPDGPRGSEADVVAGRQAADGQSSEQTHVAPKKTAPVVQAVIAEEQRQMEMDFGGQVADAETVGVDEEAQMRSAVDGLDDMEAMLREEGEKLGWRS